RCVAWRAYRCAHSAREGWESGNVSRIVDAALRCAGWNHAWATTALRPWPLGSALHSERHLHVVNNPGAIFNDHIPARLSCFYPRNLLENRRGRPVRQGAGTDRGLVPGIARTARCLVVCSL